MVLWLARVLLSLRSNKSPDTGMECSSGKNMASKKCGPIYKPKVAFVHWYRILQEKELCMDEIDKNAEHIQLIWQPISLQAKKCFFAAKSGLVAVGSIGGLVHLEQKYCI